MKFLLIVFTLVFSLSALAIDLKSFENLPEYKLNLENSVTVLGLPGNVSDYTSDSVEVKEMSKRRASARKQVIAECEKLKSELLKEFELKMKNLGLSTVILNSKCVAGARHKVSPENLLIAGRSYFGRLVISFLTK